MAMFDTTPPAPLSGAPLSGAPRFCNVLPLLLKEGATRPIPGKGKPGRQPEDGEEGGGGAGRHIVCRNCRQRLCRESDRMVVNGSHVHVFCNPSGLVFEVACFARAGGCLPEGAFVSEFSWFPGHAWQIALCAGCGRHLGWRFRGLNGQFHGLITSGIDTENSG